MTTVPEDMKLTLFVNSVRSTVHVTMNKLRNHIGNIMINL